VLRPFRLRSLADQTFDSATKDIRVARLQVTDSALHLRLYDRLVERICGNEVGVVLQTHSFHETSHDGRPTGGWEDDPEGHEIGPYQRNGWSLTLGGE
jgi:hypothetical protein